MKALIQRVSGAKVDVAGETIGEIGQGLLVLLAVERNDDKNCAEKLAEKLVSYRVFSDAEQRMNLSLRDIAGELLLVSQFTLAAETKKGLRPGFSSAAAPDKAEALYNFMAAAIKEKSIAVQTGRFGANMQLSLINDGPVTFLLEV